MFLSALQAILPDVTEECRLTSKKHTHNEELEIIQKHGHMFTVYTQRCFDQVKG